MQPKRRLNRGTLDAAIYQMFLDLYGARVGQLAGCIFFLQSRHTYQQCPTVTDSPFDHRSRYPC